MSRIYLVLGVGGGLLVVAGLQGVYTRLLNWSPELLTCEDVYREPPDREWIELEDCALDLDGLFIETRGSGVSASRRVYVPLRPVGAPPEAAQPAAVVLVSEEEHFLALISSLERGALEEEQVITLDEQHRGARHTYRGLVQFGRTLDDDARSEVVRLSAGAVGEDPILLADGEEPAFIVSALEVLGGLVMWAILLAQVLHERRRRA